MFPIVLGIWERFLSDTYPIVYLDVSFVYLECILLSVY